MRSVLPIMLWASLAHVGLGQDLTGVWREDNGGTYKLQQIGDRLMWHAQSDDCGRTWQHVFSGSINDQQIEGEFMDLPTGQQRNSGHLVLSIRSEYVLLVDQPGGGFGGRRLVRYKDTEIKCQPTELPGVFDNLRLERQLQDAIVAPPREGNDRGDSAIEVPAPLFGWFRAQAALLERAMRALCGDAEVEQYLRREYSLRPGTDVRRTEYRTEAMERILRSIGR